MLNSSAFRKTEKDAELVKISLINMPFAPVGALSIGLAQIESVLKERFGRQVEVRTHYLNIDFADEMSFSGFYHHAVSPYGRMTGLADWFFRSAAFPQTEDNIEAYLSRYYFDGAPSACEVAGFIRKHRSGMYAFLDDLIAEYHLSSSDIVGFSLSFFQTTASIAMADRLKAVNPEITVVFGGPLVKGRPGYTLACQLSSVDYVFSGPGLVSFPEFVSSRLAGKSDAASAVQGIFAAGRELKLPPEKNAGLHPDINSEISLDYKPFLDRYEECVGDSEVSPYLLMQTSHGCWWADRVRCTFCGLNCLNNSFGCLDPDTALRHINSVLEYSDRVSCFVACDNIVPPGYFEQVFPRFQVKEGVFIKYETRPDITAEQMHTLVKAGVRCVQAGIEALSTESLRLMRKGVSAFNNILFLKNCVSRGLYPEWNLLLFSPGEDESVLHKYSRDIPNLTHLQPPVGVFPVEFVRDSLYFDNPEKFGLNLEPHESLFYIYPFDRAAISNLAFRFYDKNADLPKMNFWLEKLGGMIETWRERWSVAPEKRPRLILWRDEHSAVIHDSRFEKEQNFRIGDDEEKLLKVLENTPMTAECAAVYCGFDEKYAIELMDALTEHGLFFQENGKYMSLVRNCGYPERS
ncbi:MAG: RiPP maturation radical SAM C-methyltransferase [Kiritimatiellia bacterium]